ncbi:MAG: hypothetical protein KA783_04275, partial [Chitinophagales bacterium]|nr:hypothetical protein [Chitinophagales bacterium]
TKKLGAKSKNYHPTTKLLLYCTQHTTQITQNPPKTPIFTRSNHNMQFYLQLSLCLFTNNQHG